MRCGINSNRTRNKYIIYVSMGLVALFVLLVSCGISESVQHGADFKPLGIVGGHEISISDAPYMASLLVKVPEKDSELRHVCGGSIIDEYFILTAAHCIMKSLKYTIRVGSDNGPPNGKEYDAEKLIPHKKFTYKGSNDISLIKLAQPIEFGPNVTKINLSRPNFTFPENATVKITGWGQTEVSDELSSHLRQVIVPHVPSKECRKIYKPYPNPMFHITQKLFCAGGNGKNACHGDSGGPVTYDNAVVGIVSRGHDCESMPGIYTKVSAYLDWIDTNIKKYRK